MPRKKSRRRGGSYLPAVIVVVLLAGAIGGWLLLGPRSQPPPSRVSEVTPGPAATPVPTLAPTATALPPTPSPSPAASPSAAASPSSAETPLPTLSPRPGVNGSGGTPKLALIVDDCGQWITTERGFLALGVPLTMSVLPDVPYTGEIAREAASAGKGVMLHLPMETLSGMDPGPGKVTTEMTDAQITAQVQHDLDQVPLAAGVNNHEGSKGSADPRLMRDVIDVLAKRGDLFFIDSRTNPASVGEQTASAGGVPTAARDVFLDNQTTVAYTIGQLREAAAIAKRTGSAIAIGHPRATTLEAVRQLIPELQAEGIEFVLARELVGPARH